MQSDRLLIGDENMPCRLSATCAARSQATSSRRIVPSYLLQSIQVGLNVHYITLLIPSLITAGEIHLHLKPVFKKPDLAREN